MSDDRTIDNKIVSLDFNCDNFKKKLKDTEERIDSFNDKVDNIGSSKSGKSKFDELNDDANKLSKDGMSNVEKVVDAVKVKFDAFGVIGKRILEDITDLAFNAGAQLVKSLTVDQITESWSKYEAEVQAVQLLVTSLSSYIGKGSGAKKEYTNEQIEDYSYEKLKTLKWFADETSYSYSSMTNALAGFIRSGYHNVNASVEAIQGIATAAASAGVSISQSQELYSVWSTVISGGTMMTRQFDQLNKTYKAFTGDFKKTLLEAAAAQGTIKKLENGTYQTLKGEAINIGNMRQYLNERIITADVAIQALEEYGQVSRKLNEMWEKDGIRAAEGLEKLRKANANVTDPKKIEELKKQGMYFSTIQLNAFEAAQACKTYADAVDATKDAVSTQWAGIWKSITGGYTEAKYLWTELCDYLWELFVPFVHYLNKAMEFWHAWGGWDKLFSVDEDKYGAVWKLFNALLDIINAVQEGLGRVFPLFSTFNDEAADFETNAKKIAAYLKYYTYKFSDWVDSILPKEEQLQTISDVTQGVVTLFKAVGLIAKFASKYLKIAFDFVWDLSEPLRLIFIGLIKSLALLDDSSKKIGDNFQGAFGGMAEILIVISSKIKTFLYPILIKLFEVGQKIMPLVQGVIGFASILFDLITQIASPIIYNAIDTLSFIIDSLTKLFTNQKVINKVQSFGNIFITLSNIISGAISDTVTVLSTGIENIIALLSTVTHTASNLVEDISQIIGDTVVSMFEIAWNVMERIVPLLFDKLMTIDWMDVATKVGLIATRLLSALWNVLLAVGVAKLGTWVRDAFNKVLGNDIRKSIAVFFRNVSGAIRQYMIKGNVVDILKQVANAFAILAGSLFLLGSLDFDRIMNGLIGIFGALGAMMIMFKAVMGAVDKNFASPTEAFKKVINNSISYSGALTGMGAVLLSVGLSFVSMAIAIAILGKAMTKNGITTPRLIAISAVLGALMSVLYGITEGLYSTISKTDMLVKGSNKIIKNVKKLSKVFNSIAGSIAVIALSMSALMAASQGTDSEAKLVIASGVIAALMVVVYAITSAFYDKFMTNAELLKANKGVIFKAISGLVVIVSALAAIMVVFSILLTIVAKNNISETKILSVAGSIAVLLAATALLLMALFKGNAKLGIAVKANGNIKVLDKFGKGLDKLAKGLQLLGIAAAIMALIAGIGAIILAITYLSVAFKGMTPGEIATVLGTLVGIILVLIGSIALIDKMATKNTKAQSKNVPMILGQMLGLSLLVAGMSFVLMKISDAIKGSNVTDMWHSVGMIGSIFAMIEMAMLGLMGLSNIKTGDTKKLSSLQVNMMFLGMNIGNFAKIITQLQPLIHDDPGSVWAAYGVIAAVIGLIGLVIFAADKYRIDKNGITNFLVITGLALAISIAIQPMTYALKTLAEVSKTNGYENMWAAAGVIGATIGVFLAISVLLGQLAKNPWILAGMAVAVVGFPLFGWGLQLIAKGIEDMIPSMQTIASIDPGSIWNSVAVISVLLLALSAIGGTGLVSGIGLALLGAGLYVIGIALRDAFVPGIQALITMPWDGLKEAGKKLIFFTAALSLINLAVVGVLPTIGVLTAILLGFLLTAAVLLQSVAMVEDGFALLVETLATYGKEASENMGNFITEFSKHAEELALGIGTFLDTVIVQMRKILPKLTSIADEFIKEFNNFLITTSDDITYGVTGLLISVTSSVNQAISDYGPELISSFVGMVTDLFIAFVQAIGESLIKFGEDMGKWMQEHHTEIINSLMTFADGLASICEDFLDNKEYFQGLWNTSIGPAISSILTMIQPQLTTMFGVMLKTALLGIMTGGTALIVTGAISSVAGWVAGKLSGMAKPIDDKYNVKDAADKATKDAKGTFANWFLEHPMDDLDGQVTPKQILEMQTRLKSWAKMLATYNGVAEETVLAADVSSKKFDNYVKGLEKAVEEGKLDAAGKAIANDFLDAYHKTMDMHSPSKETTRDGELTVQGLINGVKSKFETFKNTVWELAGEVKDVFAEAFGFDQGKDSSSGFNILELMGLSDKNEDGTEKTLEQRFKEMLGIRDGEDGGSILDNIFGTNDFNINDWMGDSLTPDAGMFADMDAALSETADTADNTSEAISNAQDEKAKAAKANANTSSSRNAGQMYQNPQPGYTIIQNNYSPKALNSTEIYRRTKSTFAKLEGIKSV